MYICDKQTVSKRLRTLVDARWRGDARWQGDASGCAEDIRRRAQGQGGGGRVHIRAGQVFYASFLSQDGRRSSRSPSPQGRAPECSNELSGKIGNFLFFKYADARRCDLFLFLRVILQTWAFALSVGGQCRRTGPIPARIFGRWVLGGKQKIRG